MNTLSINIVKLKTNAILPDYQTGQAAGMDLHACIGKSITLNPMDRMMIPTGLAIELPIGHEAQIRARSGLSINNGITMVNGVGTIDSDYRGEVGVLVVNLGSEPFTIEPDTRIAQMVVSRYERVAWNQTELINQTSRGSGGYGSTGTEKN